jgi:hypothetical protein
LAFFVGSHAIRHQLIEAQLRITGIDSKNGEGEQKLGFN